MATISKSWTDSLLDGSVDTGDKIDDQMNNLASAVHERELNGGHHWPSSADAKSGIHVVSADNYRPNKWDVFDSGLTTPLLTVEDTGMTISKASGIGPALVVEGNFHSTGTGDSTVDGNLSVSGSLKQGGNDVLTTASGKRIIALTWSGAGSDSSDSTARIYRQYVPVPVDGTLVRFLIHGPSGYSYQLRHYHSPTWSGDNAGSYTETVLLDSVITSGNELRKHTLSTSVSLGDQLKLTMGSNSRIVCTALIEVDW